MKKYLFVFAVLLAVQSWAGVFLENLPGSTRIFRGRAPKSTEMNVLKSKGITSVVIFKNQLKSEVDDEIAQLTEIGISEKNIHHIPFMWKDFTDEQLACEQVVDALSVLAEVQNSRRGKVLFHCTVGEDRTGLLAGLMTQLLQQQDTQESYTQQMCAKGYAGGNSAKPPKVAQAVDRFLTPLYFKISSMIESGELSLESLNKQACRQIPAMNLERGYKTCTQLSVK